MTTSNDLKTKRTSSLTLHKTATGNFFLPTDAKADKIANAIINGSIYDENIVIAARKYIRKGTAVLDVGANFGQMSVQYSRMVGAEGAVYSFEADDFVYGILEKNLRENNCRNAVPVFGAVHKNDTEVLHFPIQDFIRFGTYGSYGIDYKNRRGREVPSVMIDKIAFSKPISFMKVDIQGGDLFAMMGAVKTINQHRMPIVFEYERVFQEELCLYFQDYADFVRSIDYFFYRVIDGHNYLILPQEHPDVVNRALLNKL